VDTIWRLFFIGDSLAKRMTSAAEEQQQQQVAIANVWKQLHYDQLKQQLEKMSLDILEKQNESKASRNWLKEATREFKHSSAEEKAKNFSALLKSYQSEVDRLTSRAAFAEGCFFQVYQQLYATTVSLHMLALPSLVVYGHRILAYLLKKWKNGKQSINKQWKKRISGNKNWSNCNWK